MAGFGYVNSLISTLAIPEFINSELRRYGVLGMAAMIAIPAVLYLSAALLLFVSPSNGLEAQEIFPRGEGKPFHLGPGPFGGTAACGWQGFAVLGAIGAWMTLFTRIAQYWAAKPAKA